jgi:hypothetical protein
MRIRMEIKHPVPRKSLVVVSGGYKFYEAGARNSDVEEALVPVSSRIGYEVRMPDSLEIYV